MNLEVAICKCKLDSKACDTRNFVSRSTNGDLYIVELNAIVEGDYCTFYCAAFRYDGGFRS